MIKIYGSPLSSAGRCYWCLEEIGLKYERMPLDMRKREHKSAEYLKINPNGKVPTLIDGDLTIWESMAINFYLGDNYKQQLIGASVKNRALIRQWSFWALADLQPGFVNWLIQEKFVPEDKRDLSLIEKSKIQVVAPLEALNASIANKSFLVANDFTLADLNVASVINIAYSLNYDLSKYTNIVSWYKGISDRPAFGRYMKLCAEG